MPAGKTSCKRGEEYCILLYSEKKGDYLRNIGYIGEQLDLYLASLNIGACGLGSAKQMPGIQRAGFCYYDSNCQSGGKQIPEGYV